MKGRIRGWLIEGAGTVMVFGIALSLYVMIP